MRQAAESPYRKLGLFKPINQIDESNKDKQDKLIESVANANTEIVIPKGGGKLDVGKDTPPIAPVTVEETKKVDVDDANVIEDFTIVTKDDKRSAVQEPTPECTCTSALSLLGNLVECIEKGKMVLPPQAPGSIHLKFQSTMREAKELVKG